MATGSERWVLRIHREPKDIAKHFKESIRPAGIATGKYWHHTFLPLHFKMLAFERYGYRMRSGMNAKKTFTKEQEPFVKTNKKGERYVRWQVKTGPLGLWGPKKWVTIHGGVTGYTRRKLRKFGHMKPLVYTGALENALRGMATIRATNRSFKVGMSGPPWLKGYVRFRGRRGTGPDMVKEITTVTEGEAIRMRKKFRQEQINYIRKQPRKNVVLHG